MMERMNTAECPPARLLGEKPAEEIVGMQLADKIRDDVNECNFLLLYNELCQRLGELHNSVNQYCPNHQYMALQNHG